MAAQARLTAANVASNVQKGTKSAAESFNTQLQKFVEGSDENRVPGSSSEPERTDFWDSFGKNPGGLAASGVLAGMAGEGGTVSPSANKQTSSIGTSAMKSGTGGEEKKETWGDDNW